MHELKFRQQRRKVMDGDGRYSLDGKSSFCDVVDMMLEGGVTVKNDSKVADVSGGD